MLKKLLFILILSLGLTAGFSARAASGTCPTDNGAGVGCNIGIGEYYCLSACRTGQTQCPSWTGTICADGLTCPANCASADSCGYCNSCASGYTLCGSYPSQTCTANTTAPTNCTSYNQCTATCSACAQGYVLTGGLCVGATLKLGSDSVGALNHIFQSTNPALYVLPSGNVGIGTSTPSAAFEVIPATGYSILAGNFKIGNVALPTESSDAATKGYIDSALAYIASTSTFWDGSIDGNIWSLNSGNVGIGTTSPNSKLNVLDGTVAELRFNSGASNLTPTLAVGNTGAGGKFAALVAGTSGSAFYYDDSGFFDIVSSAKSTYTGNSIGASGTNRLRINASGNVGIGTTTPAAKLHVYGNGTTAAVFTNGNVGIGTTAPGANLDIYGNVIGGTTILKIGDANNNIKMGITGAYTGFWYNQSTPDAGNYFFQAGNNRTFFNAPAVGNSYLAFRIGNDTKMTVLESGSVGIGTTTPTARLSVVPASGYSILAGNFKIGNVALPTEDADAATKGYIDSALSYMASTSVFWDGSIDGNIWSLNSGNVGIGTTAPGSYKLNVNGTANFTNNITAPNIVYADGTILYHNVKWFTPTGTVSSNGTTVTSSGTQFTSAMVSARLIINGEARIITAYVANNQVTVSSAYSTNYSAVDVASWGVYSRAYETSFFDGTYNNVNNVRDFQNNRKMYFDANGNFTITSNYSTFNTINGTNYLIYGTGGLRFSPSNNDSLVDTRINRISGGLLEINSGTNGAYRDLNLRNLYSFGAIGIGTTTPTARLSVVPASGYSILAGDFRIGNVALPTENSDAATKGYVDSALSSATSSMTTIATYVGMTTVAVNGSNGSYGDGYNIANDLCDSDTTGYSGSHVCTSFEMLYSIISGITMPAKNVWIFVGPPAYTASANDCEGRTSAAAAPSYGAYWEAPSANYPQGRGLLGACSAAVELACCR